MKFSIITCTYNSFDYIQKNIDSVKNQDFHNFEHIFIDGFSSDGTVDIIKEYQSKFPEKVKLFQFEPKGIANAMNEGIKKSNGEYIIHLHSDDSFYSNQVLKNVSELIKIKEYPDMIYGKAIFFDPKTHLRKIIPHRKIYYKLRFWLILLTNYIPHQATFIKKKVFKKYGLFEEKYKNSMDYEMWLRLSKNKIKISFFNNIVCNFLIRPTSQSTLKPNNSTIEHLCIQKNYIRSKSIRLFLTFITKINSKRKLI